MSNRPDRPESPKGIPTAEQLKAWFKELKRYDAALKKWDENLQTWENNLQEIEESLHELELSLDQCVLDDCDDDEDDDPQECTETNPCGETSARVAVKAKPIDAGAQAEIEWLTNLHKLPDRRRKKK